MRRVWKWLMVGWSALMGVWLISSMAQGSNCREGQAFEDACRDGEALGLFAAFVLILFVWTLGMVLLGVAWRVSSPTKPPAPPVVISEGWHPDPRGEHRLRWWDGRQWTGHVSD